MRRASKPTNAASAKKTTPIKRDGKNDGSPGADKGKTESFVRPPVQRPYHEIYAESTEWLTDLTRKMQVMNGARTHQVFNTIKTKGVDSKSHNDYIQIISQDNPNISNKRQVDQILNKCLHLLHEDIEQLENKIPDDKMLGKLGSSLKKADDFKQISQNQKIKKYIGDKGHKGLKGVVKMLEDGIYVDNDNKSFMNIGHEFDINDFDGKSSFDEGVPPYVSALSAVVNRVRKSNRDRQLRHTSLEVYRKNANLTDIAEANINIISRDSGKSPNKDWLEWREIGRAIQLLLPYRYSKMSRKQFDLVNAKKNIKNPFVLGFMNYMAEQHPEYSLYDTVMRLLSLPDACLYRFHLPYPLHISMIRQLDDIKVENENINTIVESDCVYMSRVSQIWGCPQSLAYTNKWPSEFIIYLHQISKKYKNRDKAPVMIYPIKTQTHQESGQNFQRLGFGMNQIEARWSQGVKKPHHIDTYIKEEDTEFDKITIDSPGILLQGYDVSYRNITFMGINVDIDRSKGKRVLGYKSYIVDFPSTPSKTVKIHIYPLISLNCYMHQSKETYMKAYLHKAAEYYLNGEAYANALIKAEKVKMFNRIGRFVDHADVDKVKSVVDMMTEFCSQKDFFDFKPSLITAKMRIDITRAIMPRLVLTDVEPTDSPPAFSENLLNVMETLEFADKIRQGLESYIHGTELEKIREHRFDCPSDFGIGQGLRKSHRDDTPYFEQLQLLVNEGMEQYKGTTHYSKEQYTKIMADVTSIASREINDMKAAKRN